MNALTANSTPTELRIALHRNGYRPLPVSDPNPQLATGGKAPLFKNWRIVAAAATEATITKWESTPQNHGNTGLLCGDLVGLDLDIPVPDLADQIARMADAMLGHTPLVRIGKAPKSLRCYRAEQPMQKLETAELVMPCGTVVQVEAMGEGQQVVAYGTHPATMQPYRWQGLGPDTVTLGELPVLTEGPLRGFLAAAEAVLRQAGGRTKKEIEIAEKAAAGTAAPPQRLKASPTSNGAKDGSSKFFAEVNRRALANIQPWFLALFPKGEEQVGSGLTRGCWRISSSDLARSLEEDISVHPTEGGHDFGTGESCSPIDLAIEWAGAPAPKAAAFWICDKLGITPDDCGWTEPKSKKERPKRAEREPTGKPVIRIVAGELHTMTTAAEDALITAGTPIYQRGNNLVRPVAREAAASHGRTTLTAGLAEVTLASMVDLLCHVAEWEKFDARAEDWVRANPPRQVAEILLARAGFWRVPTVIGVVTTPTMRPDGTILSGPGYDPATRLYHAADPTLTLHPAVQKPTRADAEKALALLLQLLSGFPFVDEIARAVALSALITPVARGAIPVAPMHIFRAPTAGSGKSYAVDVASVILTGRLCPVITAAADEAETEKRLVGLLLAGFPLVSLDNVNGELGGDLLCQAIERPFIRVRALGRSDITEIESRSTIVGTGNNARVRGDMVRRTLLSDLDAGMERPETRTFTSDPVAAVLADRSRYVSACLIIVRAYLLAGQPGKLPPIASFAEWSGLIRSALVWLGCADPAESMKAAREDDPELGELREVMAAWWEAFGTTAATVREAIEMTTTLKPQADENGDVPTHGATMALPYPALKDALQKVAGVRGVIDAKRLGMWLAARKGRPIGSKSFKRGDDTRDSTATWMIWSAGK